MTQFHVGQRVVCVDDYRHEWRKERFLFIFKRLRWVDESLRKGSIYTISAIGEGVDVVSGEIVIGVNLKEVPPMSGGVDFKASRFRPVICRKTDISQFKAMLSPQKTEVTA